MSTQNPGNYTVKAFDFSGNADTAITCQVAVEADNRQLQVVAAAPRGPARKSNFSGRQFSRARTCDGISATATMENGGAAMIHAYARRAISRCWSGRRGTRQDGALKTAVTVQPDVRQVSLHRPARIFFRGPQFDVEARNFAGANLKWDFGDGTVESGGGRKSHRYARPGNYVQVQVAEADAPDDLPLEKRIQVLADNRDLAVKTGVIFANSEFEITAREFQGRRR